MTRELAASSTVIAAAALASRRETAGEGQQLRLASPAHYDPLSPREVSRMMRHRGYDDIEFVDRDGAVYELTASRNGNEHLVIVDGFSGAMFHR